MADGDNADERRSGFSSFGIFLGVLLLGGAFEYGIAHRGEGSRGERAAGDPAPSVRGTDAALLERGEELYLRYNCIGCHGENGVGVGDLRKAGRDFPTDDALEAFIRHPERLRPGISMPSFDRTISDEEMPALIRYVRELVARSSR